MIKKIVIAGCRDYTNYSQAKEYIDICISNIRKENEITIVSGGAKGAYALGERYAKKTALRLNAIMPNGIYTAEVRDQNEMN